VAGEFWLTDAQWGAIDPLLPKNQPGARRSDDRRVISGIVHVLRTGLPLPGLPIGLRPGDDDLQSVSPLDHARALAAAVSSPRTRQPRRGSGDRQQHRQSAPVSGWWKRGAEAQAIGRSRGGRTTKIHAIVDARGRPIAIEVTPGHLGDVRVATALISAVPPGARLAADAAYDSDGLRRFLLERGTVPVIPNNPTRKRRQAFDEIAYRQRNLIERMFCRLKDWRRIATRYDKLAANFAAAIMLAAVVLRWI
jgi:transposase